MKTVTLGITTYGGDALLQNCLMSIQKSIRDQGYSNVEVVVVDDGSPNKDRLQFVSNACNARFYSFNVQLGNVARYNTIVEESKGDIIFLIDNDVVIPNRWFWSALHFLENNVGVASYLSQKVTKKQVEKLLAKRKIPAIGSGRCPERATELAGYCFGFTIENFEKVGGFDAENFKYFLGDSDFCCRLAQKGLMSYRLLYPMVYHIEHVTYDAYSELKAWERVKEDVTNFKKKWGHSAREIEQKFLKKIEPQRIKWYAHYAHYEDWDVEGYQPFRDFRPHVISSEELGLK